MGFCGPYSVVSQNEINVMIQHVNICKSHIRCVLPTEITFLLFSSRMHYGNVHSLRSSPNTVRVTT